VWGYTHNYKYLNIESIYQYMYIDLAFVLAVFLNKSNKSSI
jgi:hypothetical protein